MFLNGERAIFWHNTYFVAHNDHCWLQKSAGRSLNCWFQEYQPPAVPRSWVGFQTFMNGFFFNENINFSWGNTFVRTTIHNHWTMGKYLSRIRNIFHHYSLTQHTIQSGILQCFQQGLLEEIPLRKIFHTRHLLLLFLCDYRMVADPENPLVLSVLHASSTAYSFSPDKAIDDVSNT